MCFWGDFFKKKVVRTWLVDPQLPGQRETACTVIQKLNWDVFHGESFLSRG